VIIGSAVMLQRDRIRSVAARETPIPVILRPQAAPTPAPAPPEEAARRDHLPAARDPRMFARWAPRSGLAPLRLRHRLRRTALRPFPPPQSAASPSRRTALLRRAAPTRAEELDRSAGSRKGRLPGPQEIGDRGRRRGHDVSAASAEPARPPISSSFLSTEKEARRRSSAPARRSGFPTCAAASTS
jgi:hypothetical protein